MTQEKDFWQATQDFWQASQDLRQAGQDFRQAAQDKRQWVPNCHRQAVQDKAVQDK